MYVFILLAVAVFGLLFGSFISAYSYRLPRNIGISTGRSKCPTCKKGIPWYDNIPVFSYLRLSGKSRCCKKPISIRYPLIELGTALLAVMFALKVLECVSSITPLCTDLHTLGLFSLLLFGLLIIILVTIFVIDFEHQLIPDNLVFALLPVVFLVALIEHETLFSDLVAGFGAALFLLSLNFLTKGRGMGLGDVKLAIPLGMILGAINTFYWMNTSFVIGAVAGVILILVGKAHFGKHIPFGPFLILAFFLIYLFGFPVSLFPLV